MCVLILNIGQFVDHLAFEQQIPQVAILQEPSIKLPEHFLATGQSFVLLGGQKEQVGQVARSCDVFHLFSVVSFAFLPTDIVLLQ